MSDRSNDLEPDHKSGVMASESVRETHTSIIDTKKTADDPISQDGQDLLRPRYDQFSVRNATSYVDRFRPSALATSVTESISSGTMDRTHVTSEVGAQSTYSYDSSRDFARYFKEIGGRWFASSQSTYMLPFDETEFGRLDRQHAALYIGLGSLYPCPDVVEHILAPQPGVTKQILDLGCGTGAWVLAMARQFPHAQIVGVDIAPTPVTIEQVPPNVQFEVDDINLGLPQFSKQNESNQIHDAHVESSDGSHQLQQEDQAEERDQEGNFELVHMRCVGAGLPNYAEAITIAARCLKPGGILIVGDLDMNSCAEDMVSSQKMALDDPSEAQGPGSWLQRQRYEFRWVNAANGTDIFEAEEMLDRGLWDHPLLNHSGAASLFTPLGPWLTSSDPVEADRLRFTGILQRQINKNASRAFHTMMRHHGIPQNVLDDWTEKIDKELDDLSVHSWRRFRMLWGIRKGKKYGTNEEHDGNEEYNKRISFLDTDLDRWKPNRQIHVYATQEEAIAARNRWLGTVGEVAEPFVLKVAAAAASGA